MAAIAHVFTIGYVANLLGEDEDWLYELSTDLFPEDGCLWVYGVGEDGVPAFTKDGIENLRQTITDLRAAGRAPPEFKSDESACGAHRMLTVATGFATLALLRSRKSCECVKFEGRICHRSADVLN